MSKNFLSLTFLCALFFSFSCHDVIAAPEKLQKDTRGFYASGRLLVKGKSGTQESRLNNILSRHSATIDRKLGRNHISLARVPAGLEKKILAQLLADPAIEFAELDRAIPPSVLPNDPYFPSQWHHVKINSASAWDNPGKPSSVIIAILDTGVDQTHPDLGANILPGWNIVSQNTDVSDIYGHGTQAAGTASAIWGNGAGVAGVSKTAKILPVRITNSPDGYAYFSDIAAGITWAADHGAKVVSNSYAAYTSNTVIYAANYLRSKGGIAFFAAGNSAIECAVPANIATMVIAATDRNDSRTSWSNYGSCIDLTAPGSGIYTTTRGGGYAAVSGTSFSTPLAAGLAAFLFEINPDLSADEVEKIIKETAYRPSGLAFDNNFGYGRIDAGAAAAMAKSYAITPPDTQLPVVAITAPRSGRTVSGQVTVTATASDNVGVSKFDLYVNGAYYGTDTSAPYAIVWDTIPLGNSIATLTAQAYDSAGNRAISSAVQLNVKNITDTLPPVVTILNPANNAKVSGIIPVKVEASDNAAISVIKLVIDGKHVATSYGTSLTYNWNTKWIATGAHSVRAIATDTAKNTSEMLLNVTR